MSNPVVHAERSARKWGGSASDYLALHQWFDATKAHLPDHRHRMLLHNSFGMLLAEEVFGALIHNSTGRRVFVRDLAALHIIEDLGLSPRSMNASPNCHYSLGWPGHAERSRVKACRCRFSPSRPPSQRTTQSQHLVKARERSCP